MLGSNLGGGMEKEMGRMRAAEWGNEGEVGEM
jgi:hypothetical protein